MKLSSYILTILFGFNQIACANEGPRTLLKKEIMNLANETELNCSIRSDYTVRIVRNGQPEVITKFDPHRLDGVNEKTNVAFQGPSKSYVNLGTRQKGLIVKYGAIKYGDVPVSKSLLYDGEGSVVKTESETTDYLISITNEICAST